MRSVASFNATAASPATVQRSPWHSPVPYLFGGLAAMLGLIAFALLILACSYWRFSSHLDNGDGAGERDVESGGDDGKARDSGKVGPAVYEEKIVVIMAGDEKPRFLATPMSSRASSFGDDNGKNNDNDGNGENKEREKGEKNDEKLKEELHHHEQPTTETSQNGETQ